jgi:hypothetical protein
VHQPLQRADGGEDDEELAGLVARQRVRRTHPHRLELLGLVRHGLLAFGHARHQEGHVEAPRQVAVGDPVREQEDLVGGKHQLALAHLRGERRLAIHRRHVPRADGAAIGMAGQQHAELLEAFADGGDGLREAKIGLRSPACGQRMGFGVGGVDASTWKNVGAGREAGGRGAPRHQHLDAGRAVTHQQHGRGGPRHCGFALRVQKLAGSYHAGHYIMETR